ncbi:MAG: TonB-dependent receptor domain-containing protein [Terriglobales bacterium]
MKIAYTFANSLRCYAAIALLSALVCPAAAQSCDVVGRVLSSGVPLPGVSISASNSLTGKKTATSTELDGSFVLAAPSNGRYVVRAELPGFAAATKEVVVKAANCHQRADLEMMLQSRAQAAEQREQRQAEQQAAGVASRFQNLSLSLDPAAANGQGTGETSASANDTAGLPAQALNPDAATESVSFSSNNAQTNEMLFGGSDEQVRERIQEMRERYQHGEGGPMFGGPGMGGPGGPGGPGGVPGIIRLGGRGRFNINKPHGALFYSASDGVLDAKPYSLTGHPTAKPDYLQQRFGGTLGGPLKIPHIFDGGTKTFFFLNYFGNRSENPYDVFSTVPTLAERAGDFSGSTIRSGPHAGQPVQIFDPATGLLFANNQIPAGMINPAAQGLLKFIPQPNLPGATQNFHNVTSTTSNSDNLNLRVMHNFGQSGTPFMMGPGGGGRAGRNGPRNNLNFGLHFQRSDSVQNNPVPSIGGRAHSRAWDVPVGWIYGRGKTTNILRFDYNRSSTDATNLYAGIENVASELGIAGVSQNPFDWGIPGLSFTNFVGLNDISPVSRRNQTLTFSDTVMRRSGKHTVRWGGDFRRIYLNTRTDKNARGTFIFTGLYTAGFAGGAPLAGTGYDFADFLLGFAQQASVQYGANDYHFNANSWDLFVLDDWRVRGNLTINVGLRYEYVSPYSEANHQIANLDAAPGFAAVAPVCPMQIANSACGPNGPYSGVFPATLVNPDRNNFAPRIGIAWKAFAKTVVRAGYGINYNTTQYANIVQNLAFQPPFDFTQTNVGTFAAPLLVQNAFPTVVPSTTTNNYGVDRNYRLGYVQMWNLNVQRELSRSLVLNVDYTGTKGTHLDMLRAPNRTATGVLITGAQPFLWESSVGDSILHSGTVRLRKRMSSGLSLGGSYTFSKSIDNASSIGGGAGVVAQNDQDLAAERGLSSFDQRHRLTADYVYEFPLGTNKRWLGAGGTLAHIFGDWQWSGNFSLASGFPFTARVLGAFFDVASGVNGTLRANMTGQPIALADPSVAEWFNTAAFTPPPPGQFGDAGRNTIIGPRTWAVNMALAKTINLGETKNLELRWQANNVFNTPQFTGLDTVVNSRTFGQVITAGAMRRMTLLARFRF